MISYKKPALSGRPPLSGEKRDAIRSKGRPRTAFVIVDSRARATLVSVGDARDGAPVEVTQ